MEKQSQGIRSFFLTREEQEFIRTQQERDNIRISTKPVYPSEVDRVFDGIGLLPHQFDRRGDAIYSKDTSSPGEVRIRGGFEYFKPTIGRAIGLNIGQHAKLFGEWAIGFHGIRNNNSLIGILKEGMKAGPGQSYVSQKDYCGEKTVPRGVYFTPHIEAALSYVNPANSMVLQCLLNPEAIINTTHKSYWVVERSIDIIPYRVILNSYTKQRLY